MKKTLITGVALAIAASAGGMVHAEKPGRDGERRAPGIESLDTNGDRAISREEFAASARDKALKMFDRLDGNGNGSISKEEFLADSPDRQEKMFERLDRNKDGVITSADRPDRKDRQGKPGERREGQRGDGPRGDHGPGGDHKLEAPPKPAE